MSKDPVADLIGQASAAAHQGRAMLDGILARRGGQAATVRGGPMPGILGRWQKRLSGGLRSRDVRSCPHLSPANPQPAHWLVWSPGLLRCPACTMRECAAIHGTPADDVCDGCGNEFPVLHIIAGELPATVVPSLGLGYGPVIIRGGLCAGCTRRDRIECAASPHIVSTERREPVDCPPSEAG